MAWLDKHTKFAGEMKKLLDYYTSQQQPIVFISDGASWIRNWMADASPESISVLDFYHASAYLHTFAKAEFKDENQRKQWLKSGQKCC